MAIRVLPQHLAITGALALALCLLALLAAGSKQAHALVEEDYRTGEVIVKLLPGTNIGDINDRYGSSTLDDYFGSIGIYLVKPPDNKDAKTFAENLTSESPTNGVFYAEANYVAEAPEGDARMRARAKSPTSESDKGSADREAARNLRLSCAAQISQGKGVTVAVLDTGAQLGHPALKANFEDVARYDFVGRGGKGDPNPSDRPVGLDVDGDGEADELVGHGTHVAGIVDRVAPKAKIMPLRVLNSEGYGDVYRIAKAISYAQRHDADVINLSLGSSNHSKLLQEIIKNAIDRGVVVVAAAGNSKTDTPHYPAAGDETVAVASEDGLVAVTSVTYVDEYDKKSRFANYGVWVDIAAPGEKIRSAFPTSEYANWSGTSMATPFVSGQAALVHKVHGSLDPVGIETKILDTARDFEFHPDDTAVPPQEWTFPGQLGSGHADVCGSLKG